MLLNCGFGEDSWESLELQGDQTSQSSRKSILNIYWKDWCWNSNTLKYMIPIISEYFWGSVEFIVSLLGQSCILSPCLFNLSAEYIISCKMLGWMEHKLESRLPEEISITSDMQMILPYGRKQRSKEPLDESESRKWKSWLKMQHSKNEDHSIRSHHFMANRWRNSDRLYFGGLQKSL